MRKYFFFLIMIGLTFDTLANPYVVRHNFSETYLKIEVLKDRGLHFEIIKSRPASDRIWTSPMIANRPELHDKSGIMGTTITNQDFTLKVNQDNLCVSIKDRKQNWDFLTTCPHNVEQAWKGLVLYTNDALNAYGLGAYYQNPGTADGDWIGKVWDPLSHTMGNALRAFNKGAQSYSMFPVLYVLGSGTRNYMVLHDSVYKQMWSLNQSPWKIEGYGDQIRWFVYTDENVKKLRQKFMQITGKPPVPPKPAFGMWLSEFGYDNWSEVYEEVDSMHTSGMPVDGISLDLQWFGGSFYMGDVDRSGSRFGTLQFDTKNFPNPKETIAHLNEEKGVEVMAIEESYISQWLEEFKTLADRGFLARNCHDLGTTVLTANPWWGIGGMIDWTNPVAGDFWHNEKRQKLYELGINYHWTDLGEPEMYDPNSCYYGFPELKKHNHGDIHNIFNFKWIESIARGYKNNQNKERPFAMSRSGTIGIQRFGAAMWSGDIAANMGALTAHYNTQMHMTYSGIDYFGADVGGFHRRQDTLDGNPHELYTQWFANAVLFDFPVRAHTWNLSNQLETAPSKIGDFASNKFNLNLRYTLSPYYYSLAHDAHRNGSPIIIPMSMEFPEDMTARKIGNQKMVGPFLMGAMSARYGETHRDVYLPQGEWINYHTGERYTSQGQNIQGIVTNDRGIFRLPLFVKKGAVIPMLKNLTDKRANISGKLLDGGFNQDLELLVYPSAQGSSFTLYEDDGKTIDYLNGAVAATEISQQLVAGKLFVTINKAEGSYRHMPVSRGYQLQVLTSSRPKRVIFNNVPIASCDSTKESVCYHTENEKLVVSLGNLEQDTKKEVVVQF